MSPRARLNPPLTAERAQELLSYDPETGFLVWRVDRGGGHVAGRRAGSYRKDSYATIGVDGVRYALHRVIWLIVTGAWPVEELDHINRKKADNRWCNLRESTRADNVRNIGVRRDSSSGLRGVMLVRGVRWRATIRFNRKKFHLGYFATADEAVTAREEAAKRLFGEFSGASQ